MGRLSCVDGAYKPYFLNVPNPVPDVVKGFLIGDVVDQHDALSRGDRDTLWTSCELSEWEAPDMTSLPTAPSSPSLGLLWWLQHQPLSGLPRSGPAPQPPMEVSLHPTGQTTPTPMLTSGFASSLLQARKVRPAHPGSPRDLRPPSLMPCSSLNTMFHGPGAHDAPLPHRPSLLCSASATLTHPPRPGLSHLLSSASTASAGASAWPLVWHLLCARHCTGVFLKPHRPRSGGPVISTLQMGNLRLEGGVDRSCLRSHRTVKGTAGVYILGILTLTPLRLLGTPPSSSGPGSTDAPVVP